MENHEPTEMHKQTGANAFALDPFPPVAHCDRYTWEEPGKVRLDIPIVSSAVGEGKAYSRVDGLLDFSELSEKRRDLFAAQYLSHNMLKAWFWRQEPEPDGSLDLGTVNIPQVLGEITRAKEAAKAARGKAPKDPQAAALKALLRLPKADRLALLEQLQSEVE